MRHQWTEDEICLLGKDTDASVARQIGISARAVQAARVSRGIPAYTHVGSASKVDGADKIAELAKKIIRICGK